MHTQKCSSQSLLTKPPALSSLHLVINGAGRVQIRLQILPGIFFSEKKKVFLEHTICSYHIQMF